MTLNELKHPNYIREATLRCTLFLISEVLIRKCVSHVNNRVSHGPVSESFIGDPNYHDGELEQPRKRLLGPTEEAINLKNNKDWLLDPNVKEKNIRNVTKRLRDT